MIILALSAAAWSIAVILLGASSAVLIAIAGVTAAAIVVGLVSARRTTLDAARRVERLAGWKERLSTAVELEAENPDNPFRGRLNGEVRALLESGSPSGFIPWNLQRPAVLALASILVAVAVTAMLPEGVPGMLAESESSARRECATRVLESAAGRLEEAALDSAGIAQLRIELIGLLANVRARGKTDASRRQILTAMRKIDPKSARQVHADVQKASKEMAKSAQLAPIAAAVGQFDAANLAGAVHEASNSVREMTPAERRSAADALNAAAGVSDLPGLSEPLRKAAAALAAADIQTFRRAMRDFAAGMKREVESADAEAQAVGYIRNVLARVEAIMLGEGDPGRKPVRREADFFVESEAPEARGSGNLIVRGKPGDIREIWKQSRAGDVPVPELSDVIRNGRTALEGRQLDPEYRPYVRKYFAVESDND